MHLVLKSLKHLVSVDNELMAVAWLSNTVNLITMCVQMCSGSKVFVIHTKIRGESRSFEGLVGSCWYLGVAELMGHAHKVLLLANWDLHVIENLQTY